MRVAGNLVVHFTELLFLCSLFFYTSGIKNVSTVTPELIFALITATRGTKSACTTVFGDGVREENRDI